MAVNSPPLAVNSPEHWRSTLPSPWPSTHHHAFSQLSTAMEVMNTWSPMMVGSNRLMPKEIRSRQRSALTEMVVMNSWSQMVRRLNRLMLTVIRSKQARSPSNPGKLVYRSIMSLHNAFKTVGSALTETAVMNSWSRMVGGLNRFWRKR